MINPLQTTFDDPLYSSSNSGSLTYSACSSASTSSANLSVYSWSSNSLSSGNLSRGSSISNINEFPNMQQPARIYEYDYQKPVQQATTQIYNPYDYKLTQEMNQMRIQQPPQPLVINVQQPSTTLPMQIQATTQQLQNQIQAQIPPQIQMQQSIPPQMTTQTLRQQPQIGIQMAPQIQTTTQNVTGTNPLINNLQNPNTQSTQGSIAYTATNITNNISNEPQFIAVTNPQIQTVYAATQPNNIATIPTYSGGEIMYPQYQEVKQMPPPQNQNQYYNNIATQIPNMNNQGNFQNIYNNNQERRPNQ